MRNYDGYVQYDSVAELIEDINIGSEIEFTYNGKGYLFEWSSETALIIARTNVDEDNSAEFNSVEDALDYEIDGKPLRKIATEIQLTGLVNIG